MCNVARIVNRHIGIQSRCGNKNTMVHCTCPYTFTEAVGPIPSQVGFAANGKMSS